MTEIKVIFLKRAREVANAQDLFFEDLNDSDILKIPFGEFSSLTKELKKMV